MYTIMNHVKIINHLVFQMKVVFLDVDGVLNTEECQDVPEQGQEGSEDFIYDKSTIIPLLKRCLDNLETILRETGAKVVVTSTWRLFPDMLAFLTSTLSPMGTEVIVGLTKGRSSPIGPGRGEEVRQWLQENGACTKFVILDDEHKESFESRLFGRKRPPHGSEGLLVMTRMRGGDFSEQGLNQKNVLEIVQFFNA